MNAERFHAIVDALKQEVAETGYPEQLEQLADGFKAVSEAPNQPGPQEQVSSAREALNNSLRNARSNNFSPAWNQAIEEMGIYDLLGEPLLLRVEEIITGNEMTPSTAASEIGEIRGRVNNFVGALNQGEFALDFFKIGSEQLSPGEFEITFLIPRREVGNGLEELGEEFVNLKRIVIPFSELAAEGRPEIQVRSISSSEFQVFLDSAPATAVLFSFALERVLKIYQQILDIRLKHQELSEKGDVPDDVLKPLADHVNDRVKGDIRQITEEVIERASLSDQGRLNELKKEINDQLSALAQRVDRGFDVEVRTGELPESIDGESDAKDGLEPETRSAAESVLEAQKGLQFMNVSGKTILSLEPPSDDADGHPGTNPGI